ncbi:MAG: pilus assembly protein TadG-related protein [Terracidiphilus sp.]
MRILRDEEGQMVVLTALSITLLMGFMAMALDVSLLFRARRNAQIAADAAATAAVMDYHYNLNLTQAKTTGKTASSNNGITDGTNGATVVINMPPSMGPNTAQASFAEALVTQPNPTYFMKLFGFSSVNVTARAVAGNIGGAKGCGFVTNPTASGAFHMQGSYSITAGTDSNGNPLPACGISVASTSGSAINVTGNGGTLDAAFLATAGGASGNTSPTTIMTHVAGLTADPLASEVSQEPQPPGGCTQTSNLTSITTANVGTISGSNANNVVCFTKAVTISPGVTMPGSSGGVNYVFENGVTIGVGTAVTFGSGTYDSSTNTFSSTSGATMEIYGGSLNQSSNSLLSIYAPTAGSTNGIAILQPATNTNQLQVQFGSNNEVLDGYIYAPGAQVYMQDHGGGIVATGFVANTMFLKAAVLRLPNYNTANAATTPLTQIILVE